MEKCSIDIDTATSTHPYFRSGKVEAPGLEVLERLYVHRSYHFWKDPDMLPWLERCTKKVIEMVGKKHKIIAKYAEMRKTRYSGAPKSIWRHVVISDIKELTTLIPSVSVRLFLSACRKFRQNAHIQRIISIFSRHCQNSLS